MNRPFHALLLCTALAGCAAAPTPMHWEKPGASQSATKEDADQCRLQARFAPMPERVLAPPPRSTAERVLTREEELEVHESVNFQACMRQKGYSAKR
jgi:hypothetical protein